MQPNSQADDSNPILLSRLAGLCAIGFVLTALLDLSGALGDGSDMFFSNASQAEIINWVTRSGKLISLGIFLNALETTLLYGGCLLLLVELTRARGILPVLPRVGVLITVVTSWTQVGMIYAMVELGARGGAEAGVLALFTLGKTMQLTDGVGLLLAIGGSSVLLMRARSVPTWLAWYGIVVAVFHAIEDPLRILLGLNLVGPVGVVLGLLWLAAVGIALLVRPVTVAPRRKPAVLANA